MEVGALVTWLLTAVGGFVLLGSWVARGGPRQQATGQSRLRPPVLFGHFLLAVAGLIVWIAYLVTDGEALTWAALAALVVVALLGVTMFAAWLPQVRGSRSSGRPGPGPGTAGSASAESRFPVPVVALHGALGAVTLVLVLLVALQG